MTLIETAIVLTVVGGLLALSFSSLQNWQRNERAAATVRSLANLLRFASTEAVRTGRVHIAFLSIGGAGDVAGNGLVDENDDWVPALILDDGVPNSANQNCTIDAGEATYVLKPVDGLGWGSSFAGGAKAPGDQTAIASASGSSFARPTGAASTWVAFMPNGRPLGFDAACDMGDLGSGNGGVYVTTDSRDYAVVLNPLGGVRVHTWNEEMGRW
ncbi:MAG: GspH/FimT family pseudopilin [Deltaproteobacteria bacterium]|nr:GspH/FimT family pseudopilin [Deltaproteobacteria bacterium]